MSHQLTPAAEACRLNIKELIPAAEVTDKDNDGNVKYGGKELSFAVSKLGKELGIGENNGWTLRRFSVSRDIINKSPQCYIIALSEGASLTPGGTLVEGYYYTTNEPSFNISAGSTVLVYGPFE